MSAKQIEFLDVESVVEQTADERASDAILTTLTGVLKADWVNHPRSLQRAIGPSEIGAPCARQIAAKVVGAPAVNPGSDPLPAWLGTAGHAKLEEAFAADNARILATPTGLDSRVVTDPVTGEDAGRWITERRVEVAPGLAGTCDAYDRWTGTVIDHKFVGASSATTYRKQGPPEHYRVQAHLYGLGYRNAGYPVNRVAIWFIPRASTLAKAWVWSEPFDADVALKAVERLDHITTAVEGLSARENHAALALIPSAPGNCRFCPFSADNPTAGVWSCDGKR